MHFLGFSFIILVSFMSGDIHCHGTSNEGEYDHPNFQGLDEILKNQNYDDNEDDIYNI